MSRTTRFVTHLVRTQGLGLLALLLVLTGGAAYAAAAKDSVVSRSIKDGQVKTRDLRDNAVQAGKLAADAVTADKIAAGAVTAQKIAPGSIPGDRLVHHSVAGAKITSNSITGDKIPDETLTGFEIAPNSLFANDLASDSVGGSELKGSHVVVSPGVGFAPAATHDAFVDCPAGEHLTGGGYAWQNGFFGLVMSSTPSLTHANRWEVRGHLSSGAPGGDTLYVWALCLTA